MVVRIRHLPGLQLVDGQLKLTQCSTCCAICSGSYFRSKQPADLPVSQDPLPPMPRLSCCLVLQVQCHSMQCCQRRSQSSSLCTCQRRSSQSMQHPRRQQQTRRQALGHLAAVQQHLEDQARRLHQLAQRLLARPSSSTSRAAVWLDFGARLMVCPVCRS